MKLTLLALLLLSAVLTLSGCLERTDGGGSQAASAGGWQLAGEFGGDAELRTDSDDPLERRYRTGGFRLISGLDVTEDEVWVCDLDISRLQIFDYDGKLQRTIGSGVDAAAALPTDREHYDEASSFSPREDTSWEQQHGGPWAGSYRTHFRAADVVVRPDGYWLADQTRTSALRNPLRKPEILFIPDDGDVTILQNLQMIWPAHLAAQHDQLAAADTRANYLLMCGFHTEPWDMNYLQRGGSFNNLVGLEVHFSDNPQYLAQHFRFTTATSAVGGTHLPGGLAFAFGKLAVCDTLNQRIQLFEARTENPSWGKVIREVRAADQSGGIRFETPQDIAIDGDGRIYICDPGAGEIVECDPSFERLGAFGQGELISPHALELSPDGRHCFVTDRRSNKVYHYVRPE